MTPPGLQRRLGLVDALAIALGGVIGVGVFRTTGLVLRGTGGFAEATAMWLVVGVAVMAGAILYADLSARVPEAGGPYAYVRVAFGRPAGFVYGWMCAGIALPTRQAAVMAVIGEMLAKWLPGPSRGWAAAMLVALVAMQLLGVRAGAIAQRIFTTGKLLTILFVIGIAISIDPSAAPAGVSLEAVSFATALGACWYSYLGWQDVVLLAEELRQPRRDLPIVLIASVAVIVILYTSIHAAIYRGLGSAASAEIPALAVAAIALGSAGVGVMSGLMLSSMIGLAADSIMVRPRVAMALARDGLAPAPIAAIDRAGTPYGAILFHGSIALLLVATGSFVELLGLLVFAQGCLGVFETASYFVIRRLRPAVPVSRFHPWAPLVFVTANAAVCGLAAIAHPGRAGAALLLVGAVAASYAVVRRWRSARMV